MRLRESLAVAWLVVGWCMASGLWAQEAAPASGPAAAERPAQQGLEAAKVGDTVDVGGLKATLRKLDILPYVENDITRRFVYDKYENPKLAELRKTYELDKVVAPGKDELEKLLLLMDWSHAQIDFGDPRSLGGLRNALEILKLTRKEQKLFCVQFAAVFQAAANSLGWVARPLGIPTHSFNEVWSNQYRRWVMFDATTNFYVERDGLPLNMYEIRKAWFENECRGLVFVRNHKPQNKPTRSFDPYFVIEYPANNNWLDAGPDFMRMFVTRDQYSGDKGPKQNVIQNPAVDPYFPINQAALHLVPDGRALSVTIKTMTPSFEKFQVRLDGKAWADSPPAFTWTLHGGRNTLEAKSVNKFGIEGPVSTVELDTAR